MHIASLRGDYFYQQEAMITPANPCVLFQLVPSVRRTSLTFQGIHLLQTQQPQLVPTDLVQVSMVW